MKQNSNDNAANRSSYVGYVYHKGETAFKKEILDGMPQAWSSLHTQGYIHIHDLDAYGKTYNCLTFRLLQNFPYEQFKDLTESGKIIRVFGYLKTLFADMGNEQSGGMALANFDDDLAFIFERLGVKLTERTGEILSACIADLIAWCSNTHTRMGQTSYYVTLNIGLAGDPFARAIAASLIEEFGKAGAEIFKPNIVFKVVKGVNRYPGDRNFDLFQKALLCSAKKMIPTYLLCDCASDRDIPPEKLSVMGCRTRVADDLFGERTAVGRGNIANISIDLPRLALEVNRDYPALDAAQKLEKVKEKWRTVADTVTEILVDRYQKVCASDIADFPVNRARQMWCVPFEDLGQVFRHGTLSIGFIGLSEMIELLTGKRFYADEGAYRAAIGFMKFMRDYCDGQREKSGLNFSLLATSGELISGRFLSIDEKLFSPAADIFRKGFYTNSFHVNVDSGLSAREKLTKEGPFHLYANGGSISYLELNEAPIGNDEGLRELVEVAIGAGVRYLGINFPLDSCRDCHAGGVFDRCPVCGSGNVLHIRRVSGYLEILDGFTPGKKNEVRTRTSN